MTKFQEAGNTDFVLKGFLCFNFVAFFPRRLCLSFCYCCRYSCFYLHVCSLWMSFGVFVTGVLFQTATFVSFLLISHGYCITCELLSVAERRRTATFGCVFYLTLIGYRTSIPYFSVSVCAYYK